MSRSQREAVLRRGQVGVLETHTQAKGEGVWKYYDPVQQEQDVRRVCDAGSMITESIFGLEKYLGTDCLSYDSQIGSIGGGNHFVEVQRVAEVFDGPTAYAWGLAKNAVVVMIHTGCVSVGYTAGTYFSDLGKSIYPPRLKHPENGIFILPESGMYRAQWDKFWSALANAANFAFVNRMFLGLMMQQAFADATGRCQFRLVYDTGHNLVWKREHEGRACYVHRKGACPANGMAQMAGTEFECFGQPVLVPGSMGASSYILAGMGNDASLRSASHGAGRNLSRGDAMRHDDEAFAAFLKRFTVITPMDLASPEARKRPDILKKQEDELRAEAPYAYKDISAVIATQTDARIVRAIARVEPVFTVKG